MEYVELCRERGGVCRGCMFTTGELGNNRYLQDRQLCHVEVFGKPN